MGTAANQIAVTSSLKIVHVLIRPHQAFFRASCGLHLKTYQTMPDSCSHLQVQHALLLKHGLHQDITCMVKRHSRHLYNSATRLEKQHTWVHGHFITSHL